MKQQINEVNKCENIHGFQLCGRKRNSAMSFPVCIEEAERNQMVVITSVSMKAVSILPSIPLNTSTNIHLSAPSLDHTTMAGDFIIQEQFQPNFMGGLDRTASDPNLQT